MSGLNDLSLDLRLMDNVSITAILTIIYALGWSGIPILDRISLRTIEATSLAWCVNSGGTLIFSAYVLIFTGENPTTRMGAAMYCPYVIASTVATAATQICYFGLLHLMNVNYLIALLPVLLICQSFAAYAAFRDPLGPWKLSGMGIMVVGLTIYNMEFILSLISKKPNRDEVDDANEQARMLVKNNT